MAVHWFNPETGRYEIITEATPQTVEGPATVAEARSRTTTATAQSRTDSPAVASMRKTLPKVSQTNGGTGHTASSSPGISSMRAELERMGIPTIGGDA